MPCEKHGPMDSVDKNEAEGQRRFSLTLRLTQWCFSQVNEVPVATIFGMQVITNRATDHSWLGLRHRIGGRSSCKQRYKYYWYVILPFCNKMSISRRGRFYTYAPHWSILGLFVYEVITGMMICIWLDYHASLNLKRPNALYRVYTHTHK